MQHILNLLLHDVPINHRVERRFGVGAEPTGVKEGSGCLVLFGVEHGGVVRAETHEEGSSVEVAGGSVVRIEDHCLIPLVVIVNVIQVKWFVIHD